MSTAISHTDDGTKTKFLNIGKKAAGRLLDGKEYNVFPETTINK